MRILRCVTKIVDFLAGSGRLLMVLAKRSVGSCNFLGIDIRDKVCVDILEIHINLHVYSLPTCARYDILTSRRDLGYFILGCRCCRTG